MVGWWSHCLLPPTLAPGGAELDRVGLTTWTLKLLYLDIYNIYNLLFTIRQGENIKLNGTKTILLHILRELGEGEAGT